MRIGAFTSVVLHAGLAAAGMIVAPTMMREATPMVILPVELLTIADVTNVMAAAKEEAIQEEEPSAAPAPPPTPEPAVEEAPEIVPEALPAEKPPEPKAEPAPTPKAPEPKRTPKKKEESFEDALEGILKSVEPQKKPTAAPVSDRSTPNLAKVGEAPRVGAGDKTAMTITVADFIRDQLQRKGCWNDQKDMADARRLRTVIQVRFGRDGKFSDAPKLIEPSRPPSGDPPMQVFVQRAFAALNKCNTLGYQVPPEYFANNPPPWIDIEFLP